MIISFLQRRNPPILPSLQKMPDGKRSTVNGKLSPFGDDVESIRGCGEDNKETLAELLFGFFLHYGYEFSFSNSVVSVREGRMMSRHEKGWDNYADNKEARCRLCVEEPFNT
jgi:DNA polymerase sigma